MTSPYCELVDVLALANLLGRFEETEASKTYGKYGFVGASRLNRRTHDALTVAGHISGWGPVTFTQGGLNGGAVAASGRTHNGLDAADIVIRGRSKADRFALVEAGMECGVIVFLRGITDSMVIHGHCVMVGAQHAHPDAKAQLYGHGYSYDHGGAGLAGAPGIRWYGPDRQRMIQWADSVYNPARGWRP